MTLLSIFDFDVFFMHGSLCMRHLGMENGLATPGFCLEGMARTFYCNIKALTSLMEVHGCLIRNFATTKVTTW